MDLMTFLNISPENKIIFILLMVWTMIWKGLSLWRAGRKNDMVWFVVLFLVSTVGILDIVYFYHISKRERKS
jgi:hypothetical protein